MRDYRTPIKPTTTPAPAVTDSKQASDDYRRAVFERFRALGGNRDAIINDGFSLAIVDAYLPLFIESEGNPK